MKENGLQVSSNFMITMEVEVANIAPDPLRNTKLNSATVDNVVDTLENGLGTTLDGIDENKAMEISGARPNGDRPRKKHRRGAKKKPRNKYKPYNKLTWDEKRKLDEKDAVKAVRRREELVLQKGRPIAPYNTTQFLMEEHDPGDENFLPTSSNNHNEHSTEGVENEESCSSCSSDEYFEKDFKEFYERIHIDTLNSYSKEDLIKNVYELEQRIEILEKNSKLEIIQSLKDENQRLLKENEALKEKVLKLE